jgi:hypothetical protein
MGQGVSARRETSEWDRENDADSGTIKIMYVSLKIGEIGDFKTITLKVTELTTDKLRNVARTVSSAAKNGDITIIADVGNDFRPTGSLALLVNNPDIRDIARGIYLDALRVKGRFTYDTMVQDKGTWWGDVKRFITYLGLTFRKHAEITAVPGIVNEPIRDGFVFESQASMSIE